jgi:hypothetical protein
MNADLEANLADEFADVANRYDTKESIRVYSRSLFCDLLRLFRSVSLACGHAQDELEGL